MPRRKTSVAPAIPQAPFEPDAYAIRTCAADGGSHGGFKWPLTIGALVTCPDWDEKPECGNGLHGLIDGLGDWTLVEGEPGRVWQVVGVLRSEVVVIGDSKGKFPRAIVMYSGDAHGAFATIQPHMVKAIQAAATTGDGSAAATTGNGSAAATTGVDSAAATTGVDSAAATTGNGSAAATTGYRSAAATTGYGSAAATTGNRSAAATTGNRSAAATTGNGSAAATTGKNSIAASLGVSGTAQAGPDGWIVLAAHDDNDDIVSVRAAKVGGPEGIKPNVAYRLNATGEFVEAAQE